MTTPGGIPNLPVGALTLETLQSKLQDMSGGAMRSRAGERFPAIMGGSSGGSALSDLTPFGILTRIFSEFNSAVANADPADINGPEDLPGLLLSFIENLPVVGEFIGLLEAILGTYDGDDEILLQIQALFRFLRPDGFIDAGKLFGDLPEDIIDGIRGFLQFVMDPSWLANIMPGQIGSGWSENLLTNPGFDGEISLLSEAGWEHDAAVFHGTSKGSGRVTADGTRKTLSNKIIKGSAGQTLRVGGWVKWSGVTAAAGRAFAVEIRPFDANGVEGTAIIVGSISSPAASGGWQEIVADVSWPAGAEWIRTRIVVEASVSAGTVWWSSLQTRKGGFMPQDRIKDLPDDLEDLIGRFLGIGNALNGFLRGQGTPTTGTPADPILDWVRDALGLFTGQTNTTSTTADQAHGVGSNALTNTVSIEARLSGLADRTDSGWTARPLWASMDYTADATFSKRDLRNWIHSHSGTVSGSVATGGPTVTNYATAAGDLHNHGIDQHSHTAGSLSVSLSSNGDSLTPVTVTASQAFRGYIRCGSVQAKRLFTFLAYKSGTVSTFIINVYRMASDGGLTKVYTSADFAGAITGTLDWVQHPMPSGAVSVDVAPEDIIAIEFVMTGSGSVSIAGITDPLPLNPVGFLPRRESAVRNPSGSASPATIAAATANAQHTSTAIPYIEAAIDTGMANLPISITDSFDGSLSRLWMMTGVNEIGIASNNIGIVQSGTNLADGWAWGKFNTQLRTDQSEVGITVTSISAEEQVVWFKGGGPSHHVGLAISSGYAVLYTMLGGTRTNRTSIAIGTSDADFKVRYTAATKVFTVYRNGAQIGSWTDSGNVAPTGLGNRFGGVGLHATRGPWFGIGSTKANPIDNWLLADV